MWLGLFQPLLHDRVGGKLAAAGNMALDTLYDNLSACTAQERPVFVKMSRTKPVAF